jgi:diguanylate cyclase (GGDEF)-like protein
VNGIANIERNQAALLAQLRDPANEHTEMLTTLLTTACMLEVSKLSAARLDLPTYVNALVEVLSQFAPIERCVVRVEPGDLPPLMATSGLLDVTEDDALMAAALAGTTVAHGGLAGGPLVVDGTTVGYLAASGVPAPLADARLVAQAAELVGDSLGVQFEAERLRRRAALAKVMELIATLDEGYTDVDLDELVGAMAAMPNAVGAVLRVEDTRLAAPVVTGSGVSESPFELTRGVDAGNIHVEFTLRLALPASGDDDARTEEVVAAMQSAFGRIDRSRRLLEEAETDPLTGIGNRRRASRALAQTWNWAERKHGTLAVVMLDLDHFKRVNDTFGHSVGDEVLKAVAGVILSSIRGYDTPARWGGEEFLVVCPDTDLAGAQSLGRRLREAVPTACEGILPFDWHQTCSIGVAVGPDHADGVQPLLALADKALYAAKTAGRDRMIVAQRPAEVVRAGAKRR